MSIFCDIAYVEQELEGPAVSARPASTAGASCLFLTDKLLQGHEHRPHLYVLSNFTGSSKYYRAPPPWHVSRSGTTEVHESAIAQPSRVLQR